MSGTGVKSTIKQKKLLAGVTRGRCPSTNTI